MNDCPHTSSSKRWRPSWIESCLSENSAEEGVSFLETAIFIWHPSNFSCGALWKWNPSSASAYNFEEIEISAKKSDFKYGKAYTYGTGSTIVFVCAWIQTEHILNLLRVNKLYGLFFTAIISLPINVYVTRLICNHLVFWKCECEKELPISFSFVPMLFSCSLLRSLSFYHFLFLCPFLSFLPSNFTFLSLLHFFLIAPFVVSVCVVLLSHPPLFFIPFMLFSFVLSYHLVLPMCCRS